MTSPAVSIAPLVRDQVLEHVLYIAKHSVKNAYDWEDRVRRAMDGLAELPTHAPDPVASLRVGFPACKLVFERTYLIFYRVHAVANLIEVFYFRHGARQPQVGEP